jgi:hypothetical protein
MIESARHSIMAYLFPQALLSDPYLQRKAESLGVTPTSDYELSKRRGTIYSLGERNGEWDDSDPTAVILQLELASHYGLSGFIVDTYIGSQKGTHAEVYRKPLDNIAAHAKEANQLFCSMFCLKLPRAELPIKKNCIEDGRWLDLNQMTANKIIERACELWTNPNYFCFHQKPYISIYGLIKYPGATKQDKESFINRLRESALRKYGVEIYVVGIVQSPEDILLLSELGVDGMTQYAGLPDFEQVTPFPNYEIFRMNSTGKVTQGYQEQLDLQVNRCLALEKKGITGFFPSITVGWDASIRAESNNSDAKTYPHVPVLMGGGPDALVDAFKIAYALSLYTLGEFPCYSIFAWNEMGENSALLPIIKQDGIVDYSNLEKVREFSRMLKRFPIPKGDY